MYKKTIENIIDFIVKKHTSEKCSRVATAHAHGSAVTEATTENGYPTLIYDDGTEIHFDEDGNISTFVNSDGVEMHYLFDDAYDFFESQKEAIIDKYGNEGYDFLKKYSNMYASMEGIYMNRYLRGLISMDEFEELVRGFHNQKSDDDFGFLWGNHDRFVEMLSSMDLPNEAFYSVRVMDRLHDNDALNKAIVSDKAHVNSTAGADMDDLGIFADTLFGWKVITDFSGSSNVKGLFLGNPLMDKRGGDWEMEVNHAPGQKFERVLIDEEHRIIVQRPYKNP